MIKDGYLYLEYLKELHETLLLPVLLYDETVIRRKKERSRIRAVQKDNLKDLLVTEGRDSVECD